MALSELIRWLLVVVLAATAAAKLAHGTQTRDALRAWGLLDARARAVAWAGLVALEATLASTLAADAPGASWATAAVLAAFALAFAVQFARGRSGAPCGCFGARSRIGIAGLLRTLALAAAAFAIPAADVRPSTQTWLAVGLCTALAGLAVLTVAVLALAREVGELRLRLPPQTALSIPDEGPELGSAIALDPGLGRPYELGLAVFTSEGCRVCAGVAPAVRLLSREPGLAVGVFDEVRDAEVWQALRVPGSPYAVVVDGAGTVLAKGTFNTLAQLEGLLAFAERRRDHLSGHAAVA